MAKNRYVNTKFWDDNYIIDLDPTEKLLFIYFLTNTLTNISGIYEIALRRISFDTGIDKDMVLKILDRFEEAGKIAYKNGWIAIANFIKHQAVNPKIETGIAVSLETSPQDLIQWVNDRQVKPIGIISKALNYSNLNLNSNTNSNEEPNQTDKAPPVCEKNEGYIDEVIFLLNDATGKNFNSKTKSSREHIRARLREGYTIKQFDLVIDKKVKHWLKRDDMNRYLRPATLFGTKFDTYLNE